MARCPHLHGHAPAGSPDPAAQQRDL